MKTKDNKYLGRGIHKEKFVESLINGNLKRMLTVINNDDDLDIQIRNDYLNIYYKGGNIAKVNSEKSVGFDEFYFYLEMKKTPKKEIMDYINKYWTGNQIYGAGVRYEDISLMKLGIKNRANNLKIGGTQVYTIAAEHNNSELMKILLANSETDPMENSREGKRYNKDERLFSFRRAAKQGYYNIVKVMMEDSRIDPSVKNNWALNWAVKEGHIDVVKLLLTDPRVKRKIDLIPMVQQLRLRKLRLLEEYNFKKG